jgi:hypothetical protein
MSDDGAAASGLHLLDNLVWGALNGLHRRFSVGGDRARRYLTEVAPFAAVSDSWRRIDGRFARAGCGSRPDGDEYG